MKKQKRRFFKLFNLGTASLLLFFGVACGGGGGGGGGDKTPPSLDIVTIVSDNADTTLAKVGDTITVYLEVGEALEFARSSPAPEPSELMDGLYPDTAEAADQQTPITRSTGGA